MAKEPLTRQKAITWWIALFAISVLGTAYVMWRWYQGQRLWLGIPLYGALFVCASVLGTKADPEEIKKNLGAGLRTLIGPAPLWALAVVVIAALIWVLVGWDWFWRALGALALGVLAGLLWARQEQPPKPHDAKDDKAPHPPMDFWKT